jgi:hypothetical protein
MKTAVEWLINEIDMQYHDINIKRKEWMIDKAKEMELHQRQEDTNYGYSQGWDDGNQNKEPMRPELKQQA